jgi:hypothetical protein
VYWRRRALLLGLLLSLGGGGGWTGWAAATGRLPLHATTAAAQTPVPVGEPSLTSVLPSLAGVRVPLVPPTAAAGTDAATPAALPSDPATDPATGPTAMTDATPALLAPAAAVSGPPCTDDMIGLTLSAPRSATVGGSAALTLTVIDTSPLPCARDVGTAEQEVVLVDGAGTRLWSSADCTPASAAPEHLDAGERVDLAIAWDGRTSAAGCAGARVVVPAGSYVLRARLGTRTAAEVPLTLG